MAAPVPPEVWRYRASELTNGSPGTAGSLAVPGLRAGRTSYALGIGVGGTLGVGRGEGG
jgi:hypothetical protein